MHVLIDIRRALGHNATCHAAFRPWHTKEAQMQIFTSSGWKPVGQVTTPASIIRNLEPFLRFDFPNAGHVWSRATEREPFRAEPCASGCSVCGRPA